MFKCSVQHLTRSSFNMLDEAILHQIRIENCTLKVHVESPWAAVRCVAIVYPLNKLVEVYYLSAPSCWEPIGMAP